MLLALPSASAQVMGALILFDDNQVITANWLRTLCIIWLVVSVVIIAIDTIMAYVHCINGRNPKTMTYSGNELVWTLWYLPMMIVFFLTIPALFIQGRVEARQMRR